MLPFGEIFIATKGPNVKQIFQPSGHTAINGHLDFHLYSLFSQPCQSVRLSLKSQNTFSLFYVFCEKRETFGAIS